MCSFYLKWLYKKLGYIASSQIPTSQKILWQNVSEKVQDLEHRGKAMGLMTDRKTMAMQGYFLNAWWITKEKNKTSNTYQSKITDNLARGDETIG